jgi:hypothetical protein
MLYGKARPRWSRRWSSPIGIHKFSALGSGPGQYQGIDMVKAEWGAKHGCPKCGTRFYDLGKGDPVTCIECGYAWHPDPVLKSKQPIPYEEIQKAKVEEVVDGDLADTDLDIDEDGDSPDNDVDLGGDDDLGVGVEADGEPDEH